MDRRQLYSLLVFFGAWLVAAAAVIVYDVWIYRRFGQAATITAAMQTLGNESPVLTWLCGFVVGGVVVGLAIHFWTK